MKKPIEVNGKPAVRIVGTVVTKLKNASLLDCDGDQEWFPNSTYKEYSNGTLEIQEWIYKKKFPNE
jgi:hypothetical protein